MCEQLDITVIGVIGVDRNQCTHRRVSIAAEWILANVWISSGSIFWFTSVSLLAYSSGRNMPETVVSSFWHFSRLTRTEQNRRPEFWQMNSGRFTPVLVNPARDAPNIRREQTSLQRVASHLQVRLVLAPAVFAVEAEVVPLMKQAAPALAAPSHGPHSNTISVISC